MKKNSILFGCIVALLPPLIAHVLASHTEVKALNYYVAAAAINLLIVRIFYRNAYDQAAQGTILITFAAVLLLIINGKLSLA